MKIQAKTTRVELHTVKQLRDYQANTRTKEGEAAIVITKTADNKASLGWSGTKRDLLNLLFTTCRNDRGMAALICRAAKDHVENCKLNHQAWVDLTADIIELGRELDAADQKQEGGEHDRTDENTQG